METNNRKDRLDRLKLRSDDRDDPYDREDYMETRHKGRLNRIKERFHIIVRIVCGGGNDPYDRDDYMETRLK